MGTEKILFAIIAVTVLINIVSFIILVNKTKMLNELRGLLKSVVIKNSKMYGKLDLLNIKDLILMLDDKVLYFENETNYLRSQLNYKQQKIKKLESLNNIVSSHVNSLNKDVVKFISKLLESSNDKKDLETIGMEFKSALQKARQFVDGVYARTELLTALLNKISTFKDEKIKNSSVIAVKSTTIKNKLYSIDKILYKQNKELLDVVDVAANIEKEIKGKIQESLTEAKSKLEQELSKKSSVRKNIDFDFNRSVKDLQFVDKELNIILDNYSETSSSNRKETIKVIVNDIKEKISNIENDLKSSSKNNKDVFDKLVELERSESVMLFQIFKGGSLFEIGKLDSEMDHLDINRVVSKTMNRNEYLLQIIDDLIKESGKNEDLSNKEWERLKDEAILVADMKKNVSVITNLLTMINLSSETDEELELDLSTFRVNEDGEIII